MEKEQGAVKKTKINKKVTFYSVSSKEKELKKALEKIQSEDSAYFYGPMTTSIDGGS